MGLFQSPGRFGRRNRRSALISQPENPRQAPSLNPDLSPHTTLRTIRGFLNSLGSQRKQRLAGFTVLVRCDFNVPRTHISTPEPHWKISDDTRIRAAVPTLKLLHDEGARVLIISHLGRPEKTSVSQPVDPRFSLEDIAPILSRHLGLPVIFVPDCVGAEAEKQVAESAADAVLLLENLRLHPGETSSIPEERQKFAAQLARLLPTGGGRLLVSDGFGVLHRKQASVYELAQIFSVPLPAAFPAAFPAMAGLLVAEELEVAARLTLNPRRPYRVVLGGAKVSDKLKVIKNLLPRVDNMLIGGGMAFTFLAARGLPVASSLVEEDFLETAAKIMEEDYQQGNKILLPTDIVMASAFSADAEREVAPVTALEETRFGSSGMGLDIGPESAHTFTQALRGSATVFWNGPMGVFEFKSFSAGTKAIVRAIAALAEAENAEENRVLTVVGGGDSAAAIVEADCSPQNFSHISTGGGATLELLEGATLPGIQVLQDKKG